MAEAMFPVLRDPILKALPWRFLAPHEAQAKANHGGQSLNRLAARGGLSVCEAYFIALDRRYPIGFRANLTSVRFHLMRMVLEFETANPPAERE